jgi:hypothetical protein
MMLRSSRKLSPPRENQQEAHDLTLLPCRHPSGSSVKAFPTSNLVHAVVSSAAPILFLIWREIDSKLWPWQPISHHRNGRSSFPACSKNSALHFVRRSTQRGRPRPRVASNSLTATVSARPAGRHSTRSESSPSSICPTTHRAILSSPAGRGARSRRRSWRSKELSSRSALARTSAATSRARRCRATSHICCAR